jgi:Family of unknown function (DUF6353)
MNLSAISHRALGNSELFFKKHGPAILTATGVAGFAVTTVLVGKAAIKAKPKLDQMNSDHQEIMARELDEDYSKNDQVREVGAVYTRGGVELLKIFWPAVTVGGLSIFCVIAAHGMMRKQQAALLAAYGTLDAGFRAYRKRVEEELGKDKELELYRGIRHVQSVDEAGDACDISEYDHLIPSVYGRFFDETSPNWSKTPEYNLLFLKSQQDWANDRLRAYGHIFLNEVYDALGLPRSQAGQIVGWKLGSPNSDGFVDFGMWDITDEDSRAFVNGLERTVFLDFNVDGPITI